MKKTLLIPSMMDDHMPFLRYALASKDYEPVILENRVGLMDAALRYSHNDMCYPFHLALGQYLTALDSGEYDPHRTALLMFSAGDACRGSNFTWLVRRALEAAGYGRVEALTFNVKGVEKEAQLPITLSMAWKALFGLFYGDMLMLLAHQTRPHEKTPGQTDALREAWTARLCRDLETGKGLTIRRMNKTLTAMAADFAAIPRSGEKKKQVAVIGELYTKYCALGNWDMVAFLEGEGAEVLVNGFSWYILYYASSQVARAKGPLRWVWQGLSRWVASLQGCMVKTLRAHGFHSLDPFPAFQQKAAEQVSPELRVADGWLMGAELAAWAEFGCRRVLAIQPFGCLPNHICGRGRYAVLTRQYPGVRTISVDLDSSGTPAQVYNRVKLLLEGD